MLLIVTIQLPFTHSIIVGQANGYFKEKGIPIHVGTLSISLKGAIELNKIEIVSNSVDTIVYAGNIKIDFRLFPLLSKRVIVNSISAEDINAKLITDSLGTLNLLSLFPAAATTDVDSSKGSSLWEVQIGEVHLRNVRFMYSDVTNGIVFNQTIDNADLVLDMFSLLKKQVDIDKLVIESATGSIDLWDSGVIPDEKSNATPPWKFSARGIELNDIIFDYENSTSRQQTNIALSKAFIDVKLLDLAKRELIVSQLDLSTPHITYRDSQIANVAENSKVINENVNANLPWTLACDKLEISNGYLFYKPGGDAATDTTITQWMPLHSCTTKIENLLYSSAQQGFELRQLAFVLNDKAKIHSAKIHFDADSMMKGNMEMELLTSVNYVNKLQYHHIDTVGISMNVSGSLKNMMIEQIKLKSSSGAELEIDGVVKNVNTISESYYELLFRTNPISRNQVTGWLSMISPELYLPEFSPASVSGKLSNTMQNPNFDLMITSRSGNVGLIGNYNLINNYSVLNATIVDLKLNEIFGDDYPTDIFSTFSWKGVIGNLSSLNGTGELKVDSLKYKNTIAHDIDLVFDASNDLYHFALLANDSALNCSINGEVERKELNYHGEVFGEFIINEQHRDILPSGLSVKSSINATFNHSEENVESFLELKNITVGNTETESTIDGIVWNLSMSEQSVNSKLRSDFISVDFESPAPYKDLVKAFSDDGMNKIFSWDSTSFISTKRFEKIPEFNLIATADYDSVIMLFIDDSVFAYDKIVLEMSKVPEKQAVDIRVSIDSLNYLNTKGFGAKLNLQANENGSIGELNIDSLNVNGVVTGKTQIKLDVLPYKMTGLILVLDSTGVPVYRIGADAVKEQNQIVFTSTVQDWVLNSETWAVNPPHFLQWNLNDENLIAGLNLINKDLKIELNGTTSDSLVLNIENIPIHALISPNLIPDLPDGILNVDAVYSDGLKKNLDFGLVIDNLIWHGITIYRAESKGHFEMDSLGSINSEILTRLGDSSIVKLRIKPSDATLSNDLSATFSQIPAKYCEPFIHDYINQLSGFLSGELNIENSGPKHDITGKLIMQSISMNVVPLNSWFIIPDDTIRLSDSHIYFNDFAIYDSLNKELFVNGSLAFSEQREIETKLKVTMDNLLVMNTSIKDNPDFFGKVIVRSDLTLDGPVTNPNIKGNVTLVGGTNITYRQVNDITVQETQKTVNFVSLKADTAEVLTLMSGIREVSELPSIQTTIEIDPKSQFNFDIYSGYEIHISIGGSGLLNYALLPNNTMSLTGGYEINSGTAKLKFSGWPIKDFLITPGSTMRWDGNVSDPEINLEATSKVKGSYVNPVDNKTRTVDFIVSMRLSDQVSKLKVTFDVKSPDQYISSVLSSLSEDELMRQAINLLIFESINLPNIESNSNYLTSQINSFWESQLNSLSKTTIKGVDLSFGIDSYTQETASGGSEEKTSLTYELEKKVLRNRASVKVSGRLNDDSQAGNTNSSVLENFTFEYELDTLDRKFLKLYTRRDYEDILDGEVTKSGIGFIYRKSYPDFKSIWRRKNKVN